MIYPHWLAKILHNAPLALLVLLGALGTLGALPALRCEGLTLGGMFTGALLALVSVLLTLAFPAAVGGWRAWYSRE